MTLGTAAGSATAPSRGTRAALLLLLAAATLWGAADLVRQAVVWAGVRNDAAAAARRGIHGAEDVLLEPGADVASAAAAVLAMSADSPSARETGRRILLRAAAGRPGRTEYRAQIAGIEMDADRARTAWLLAALGAPGVRRVQVALARSDLSSWSRLTPAEREECDAAFRAACADSQFVSEEFSRMVGAVGRDRAIALLPEVADPLEAAGAALARDGDLEAAAGLFRRSVASERRERDADLREIASRRGEQSPEAIQRECASFLDRHPLGELDDADGHRQLGRLLEVWPDEPSASWGRDPRARVLSFLLDGRASEVSPAVLAKTADALTGTPPEIRARIRLRASDPGAADLARGVNPFISPEWIPFLVELADDRARRGEVATARAIFLRLPPSTRDSCDGLLLRRDLARAAGDAAELAAASARLAALASPASGSGRDVFAMCLDPAKPNSTVEISVAAGAPGLYAYGWNGARSGIVVVPSSATAFRVPAAGLSGERTLRLTALAGPSDRLLRVAIASPS